MFSRQLLQRLCRAQAEFHRDNHDVLRFGRQPLSRRVKETLRAKLGVVGPERLAKRMKTLEPHLDGLEHTWELLADDDSRRLLVELIAYRLLGFRHVKLATNTPAYQNELERHVAIDRAIEDRIDTGFRDFTLARRRLDDMDLDLELYIRPPALMAQVFLGQYHYERGDTLITVEPGDVVIDAGACWGETALFFADRAGAGGRVFSFEFVPSNLEIFRRNLELNPKVAERIRVVERPLWSTSEGQLHFKDKGPGSSVSSEPFKGEDGVVELKTIDELVEEESLERLSFIKMDIEGAELDALKGAEAAIRRFRPKLAISLYHSLADFHTIPAWIERLDLGYRFHLKHATIHAEETVLFATAR